LNLSTIDTDQIFIEKNSPYLEDILNNFNLIDRKQKHGDMKFIILD
jgi:hypothetical protein